MNLEAVLNTKLPKPYKIDKPSSVNSISDQNRIVNSQVQLWNDFENSVNNTINTKINENNHFIFEKIVYITDINEIANHSSCQNLIRDIFISVFRNCLKENITIHTEFSIDGNNGSHVYSDIACSNDKEILFIVEVKTTNNIIFDKIDIIKKYDDNNIKDNKYKKVLDQIFSYMHLKNIKYGMVSTYFETLFIQLFYDNGEPVFLISKPIQPENFLRCTYYILCKSFESNKPIIQNNSQHPSNRFELNYTENNNRNHKRFRNKNQDDDYEDSEKEHQTCVVNESDSAYSSSSSLKSVFLQEIEKAIFNHGGIIGSGRIGNVLKLKIPSYPNYLAFKHQDIYRDKYKINELKNEIKVYKWLENAGVTCIPKLVFGGLAYIFISVVTEIINGKSIEFNQMNNLQKSNCVKSLEMLHMNGVLHKDIRSSNFIFNENECFIIDFGFSQIFGTIDQDALDKFGNEMIQLKKLLL